MPENFYDINIYAMQLFYRNTGITVRTAVTKEERSVKLRAAGP